MPERPVATLLPDAPEELAAAVDRAGWRRGPIEEAEALVWLSGPQGLAEACAAAPRLRWVQLPSAGVEGFVDAGVLDPRLRWVCAKEVYGPVVAEHGIALMLAAARDLHHSLRRRSWAPETGRTLAGTHAVLVGGGGITREMLGLLAPFGVGTTVVRNRPEAVEGAGRTVSADRLTEVIGQADWVILALALTPRTHGMVDAAFLERMRPGAWLVNLARGKHVVTDDLVEALASGHLGGAALDVTEPEPLPDDHPLWGCDNVLITPHAANTWEMGLPLLAARLEENLRRDLAGADPLGPVDPELGY